MIQKGLSPDVVSYSALIHGLRQQSRTKEANRLLFRMMYDDLIPNEITYDTLVEYYVDENLESNVALIKGLCMKGKMIEAEKVFEAMLEKNSTPNDVAYSVLIHGHCEDGNIQKAFGMYNEMV
ncbi:hypothetical protein SUGI_0116840 [Cryptomeria japonica]|nr:hypothetical protein SUGI_0116840 [Cryptomeria japonica]